MRYLKRFNESFDTSDLEFDSIYSNKGIYLYQFQGFSFFESFVNKHVDIFKEVKWAINPLCSHSSAERFYNMYIEKYPIFIVIIDTNDSEVIGSSIGYNKVGLVVDAKNNYKEESFFLSYLDKLGITMEDILDI
jgi:hypothetical protein